MALGVVSFTSLMVTGEVFRKAVLLPKVGVFAVGLPVSLLSAVATSMFQTDVITFLMQLKLIYLMISLLMAGDNVRCFAA